ncbi:NAD(P)-binding protein [Apiospora rasikravindrae]|uniref:NAD(P)-binding protein n=1 Tax=Apiospora rasikravindrae TaxID=990691 RepID=A0ABR1TXC6_9PEZI
MAATHSFDVTKLFGVQGYVAVVTGGGSGIGLMAAQALAQNGAKVYITGRRMEALKAAAESHDPSHDGGQIIPAGPCDVTKKDELEKLVAEIQEKEKYIHLLVCNAGVSGPKAEPKHEDAEELKKALWENESVEQWGQTFEVDVTSVYFTTVAFLPLLQAGTRLKGGPLEPFAPSVITTSSMSGLMRHAQGHFSYNAAKGATVHLSKLMSAEFQKAGIRVNSIAPGYFPSEMTAKESDENQKSHIPPEKIQEKEHVPLMRAGREEEMGMTVLYLAKNQYVNGEIIAVDGGVLNVLAGR